jgi:hypothetical protein
MLIDQFGNPEPNNRQTATCVECSRYTPTKDMMFKVYKINENLKVVGWFCNTEFCTKLNSEQEPGRVIEMRNKLEVKTNGNS